MGTALAPLGVEYASLLGQVDLFRGLDRVVLAKLAAHLERESVSAGAVLCRDGEPGDAMYLVSRGTFGVLGQGAERPVRLNTCAPGEAIGEMALLTDQPRSATVVADEDGEVLRLEKSRFLDLVRCEPAVRDAISAGLIERLRAADAARAQVAAPARATIKQPATIRQTAEQRLPHLPLDRRTIGIGASALLMALSLVLPAPAGLSVGGWHALGSLIAFVPLLALGVLPEGPLALLLAAVWVLTGIVSPRVALGGFATSTWVLIACTLAVGSAIASCGLLYRVTLWIVARTRGGFTIQVFGLGLAGLASSAAIPDGVARTSLVAPAVAEMADAVGYEPESRPAAGLAMATLAGFGQMLSTFMTGSSAGLLAFALLPEASRQGLTWGTWALRAAPSTLILLFGMLGFVAWWYRPRVRSAGAPRASGLALQQTLLGPMTRQERITAIVSGALILGFVTQPWHGIEPAWLAAIALAVLGAKKALDANAVRDVNWNFMLLLGVLMGMADVFSANGLDRWLGDLASGVLGAVTSVPIVFVLVLALLSMALSFVLRLQAAIGVLMVTLAPAAQVAGIDPWIVALVVLVAYNTFFFAYQNTMYLALQHGTAGRLFRHAQTRPLAIAYPVLALVALAASVPWWHALRLI